VGFTAQDVNHGVLGTIIDIDETTANVLFLVENGQGRQLMLPAQDELITEIDHDNKMITFDLPEGLVTMNHEERD
jgi:16S rRNA processing protein RimM